MLAPQYHTGSSSFLQECCILLALYLCVTIAAHLQSWLNLVDVDSHYFHAGFGNTKIRVWLDG